MNRISEHPDGRAARIALGGIVFLVALAWGLQIEGDGGALPPPVATGWETLTGRWLSDLVARLLAMLPLPWPLSTTLSVFTAAVVGVLTAWLYRRLIYNDWPAIDALALVACLVGNAVVIATIVGDQGAIPVMIACAAIVTGIRRLESVGDVQAEMSFGLVLSLLFLAGPEMALLIVPLALLAASFDRSARSDWRPFLAMVLVAIMPTLLVATGIFGILGPDTVPALKAIFVKVVTLRPADHATTEALLTIAAYTILPFGIIIVAYWLCRDRRRQPLSAIAVVALPLYLVAGGIYFSWPITTAVPTMAFLGAFAAWLSVQRLTPVFRWSSIVLMLLCTLASWAAPVRDAALSDPVAATIGRPVPDR